MEGGAHGISAIPMPGVSLDLSGGLLWTPSARRVQSLPSHQLVPEGHRLQRVHFFLAPQNLSELISYYKPTHELRLKDTGSLLLPRHCKVTSGGRAFSLKAPRNWNYLPVSVWRSSTAAFFKSRLKPHLFSLGFNN